MKADFQGPTLAEAGEPANLSMHLCNKRLSLVFTMGPYRSGTTWATNVVAELLRLRGPTSLLYADNAVGLAQDVRDVERAVTKSHLPDQALQLVISLSRAPLVISVRDPLDCVASFMHSFNYSFEQALLPISASAAATLSLLKSRDALVLRFEDPDCFRAKSVSNIAECIGVEVADADVRQLADRFSSGSVKAFIDGLIEANHFGADPRPEQFHAETFWHPGHVGAGASGRYGEVLTDVQVEAVMTSTRPFRRYFDYAD